MSHEYGVDLRSKSDAQIAEAVIKAEIERLTGRRLYKPEIQEGSFVYKPPDFIGFRTPYMEQVFDTVRKARFYVDSSGVVHLPDELKSLLITIGDSKYQLGIGGIHSTESQITHRLDENHVLIDRDVTSYYPSIILNLELYPKHIGTKFLDVYRKMYTRRLAAKKRSGTLGKKVKALKSQISELKRMLEDAQKQPNLPPAECADTGL
jgi:hypothetical protein